MSMRVCCGRGLEGSKITVAVIVKTAEKVIFRDNCGTNTEIRGGLPPVIRSWETFQQNPSQYSVLIIL